VSVKFDFIFLNSDNRVWVWRPAKVGYLMYKTRTSIKKFFKTELFGGLLTIILVSGLPLRFAGQEKQEKPDLKKPFKKCWDYGGKSGQTAIVASDNNQQVIIKNYNSSLVSIDPVTKLENWKSEIRGQIQRKILSDENTLFFATDFETNSGSEGK
jgi:hypothetical protein